VVNTKVQLVTCTKNILQNLSMAAYIIIVRTYMFYSSIGSSSLQQAAEGYILDKDDTLNKGTCSVVYSFCRHRSLLKMIPE